MNIIIASDQEREKVFAEIYHNGEIWAEVSIVDSTNEVVVKLIAPLDLTMPYDEVIAWLQKAYDDVTAPTLPFKF